GRIRVVVRWRRREGIRGGAVPDLCRAVHHHAQYGTRSANRRPSVSVRDDRDRRCRLLESDVRHVLRHAVAGGRTVAGLTRTSAKLSRLTRTVASGEAANLLFTALGLASYFVQSRADDPSQ